MIDIPFIYIPIFAVCCFLFLLLALIAAKKNRLIWTFIVLLACYTLWTAGSVLMRLMVYPGYPFWYQVSILSLFTIPMMLYYFVHSIVEAKGTFLRKVWIVATAVILILTYFQVFLACPEFVDLGNGKGVFRYVMEWPIIIPSVVFLLIIISTVQVFIKAYKQNGVTAYWMTPIILGMVILFLGNILSILPGNIFPFDTLCGILNAGCLFYALYRKRLFSLTLLVSPGTLLAISVGLVSLMFVFSTEKLEAGLNHLFGSNFAYTSVVLAMIFMLITGVIYRLVYTLVDNLFIKNEHLLAQKLHDFSAAISQTLDPQQIMEKLIKVITETLNVRQAYICLPDEQGNNYRVACSFSPLDDHKLVISGDHPCIQWFRSHSGCLLMREFTKSTMYKAMWEKEKQQLEDFRIECIVPLIYDNELSGILLVPSRDKHHDFTAAEISLLDSIQSIVSIALKNANMYQTAYFETRIDHLTGLLNRKSFYEKLNSQFSGNQDYSIALIILNLDDFKLYNQLYGYHEGDLALKNVGQIIQAAIGHKGFAARYGGKEFAIILPYHDMRQALELAENIRCQVVAMNENECGTDGFSSLDPLTLSGGVCVFPYAASSADELVTNTDMAVYSAKRGGKNRISTYSLDISSQVVDSQPDEHKTNYSDYASTIYALTAAIDAKDHYTFSHSQNVAKYATTLAKAWGMNDDHVQMLYEAALLHDIGKISVPEQILAKPDKLTEAEYQLMQKHVENSVSIIRHLPSLDYVIPVAIGHHERWDGKGYPRKLKGEDIPIAARCLAIADTFDAMTSCRPYRVALSVEYATDEIERMAGTQFDPKLAELFVSLVRSGKITVSEPQQVVINIDKSC